MMPLNVELSRVGDEPWGFRLIGGADFNMPLTIVKVVPNSPADSCLQNGDTVSSISGKDARSMTHEESRKAVAQADDVLELGVTRGLYDPVLDDYEPIYEPIDQEDFDQSSHPTEVQFSLQNFPDIVPDGREYSLPKDFDPKLSESRSLTASPFVIPTKPYRPFSTEPIEVPSLEDPIILNPKYHDDFGKVDEEFLPKTRFKLPISEQYNPDGIKGKANCEVTISDKSDIVSTEEKVTEVVTTEAVSIEKMKQDIDINQIEMSAITEKAVETASSIVDESIQKAVTVAKEINKDSDVKLRESSIREVKSEQTVEQINLMETSVQSFDTKITTQKSASKETVTAVSELVGLIDKATDEVMKQNGTEIASESIISKIQKSDEVTNVQKEQIVRQNISEHDSQVKLEEKRISEADLKRENEARVKSELHTTKTSQQSTTSDGKSTTGKSTKSAKTKAKKRAYMIGLQTIPNIRGSVHSSYHYNLLLKTFFVHLTDVMVALTGFILAEHPVSEDEEEKPETSKIVKESVFKAEFEKTVNETQTDIKSDVQQHRVDKEMTSTKKSTVESHVKEEDESSTKVERLVVDNVVEKRKLSGSKMAQMAEKKGEELIHKMDAVVTEFQTKAGIEEPIITEETLLSEQKLMLQASTESSESKRLETREQRSKSREGKNTYIAIVESHVYTNEDFAVDAFSETSSIQSADEKNLAAELGEALKTETVALDNFKLTEEKAQILQESHEQSVNKDSTFKVAQDTQISSSKVEKKQATESTFLTQETKVSSNMVEQSQATESTFVQENKFETIQETTLSKEETSAVKVTEFQTSTDIQEIMTDVESKTVKEDKQECIMIELNEEENIKKDVDIVSIIETVSEPVVELIEPPKQEIETFDIKTVDIKDESVAISVATDIIIEETSSEAEQQYIATVKYEQKDTSMTQEETKVESISEETSTEFIATLNQSTIEIKDESASLKIEKEQVTEVQQSIEIAEDTHVSIVKQTEVTSQAIESFEGTRTVESATDTKESTFIAKSVTFKEPEKLTLRTDLPLKRDSSLTDIETPTPATVPPTPITDEYIFKLEIPLPKLVGPPIPNDPSPERDEDPHIVKKGLVPKIDSPTIESKVFDPPLATPLCSPTEKVAPVYTKPGLKGGSVRPGYRREEIQEIERKSSLLASAIDLTIKSIEEYKEEVGIEKGPIIYNGYSVLETKVYNTEELKRGDIDDTNTKVVNDMNDIKMYDTKMVNGFKNSKQPKEVKNGKIEDTLEIEVNLEGYRPVQFDLDEIQRARSERSISRQREIPPTPVHETKVYKTETGEVLGTHQGIVDSLDKAMVDEDVAKELGKPGLTEDKIAELISGESEMLREAHVMGLSRVLSSHMNRPSDDSSVDFKKIKPIVESLKDSEVLKALNDEFTKTREEKKKEERKWTKFLQKPKRPVPKTRSGYPGWVQEEEVVEEPYKVKIVKQPKPKVAPDYKSEDFETGPLPWEERALNEPPTPPVEAEDPILVPEESPEFLEAVDPLPESEVPDLEDTGIPLPPPKTIEEEKVEPIVEAVEDVAEEPAEVLETVVEEQEKNEEDMEQNRIAEQIMTSVQNMVDPNAPLDQQLAQMRAQLAALAQLPGVIQQTLELVTKQLSQISQPEQQTVAEVNGIETDEETENVEDSKNENLKEIEQSPEQPQEETQQGGMTIEEVSESSVEQKTVTQEEMEKLKREEEEMLEEQRRLEKQKKVLMEQMQQEQEARQLKQRPTPRVGKPKPMFGPLTPQERPVVLPGGRRWRSAKDAYNEQFFAETLSAQAELIQGKTKGLSFESVLLPYDERINFLKYEKPPVSLDHLQNSDVYKLVHNMEQTPVRRVDMLTPVICEADYREKCRSMTPCVE